MAWTETRKSIFTSQHRQPETTLEILQEISDQFYIAGAQNVSQNMSMITWEWLIVKPTKLRVGTYYSRVGFLKIVHTVL